MDSVATARRPIPKSAARRARIGTDMRRYKVFSSPEHVTAAKWLSGNSKAIAVSAETSQWQAEGRAVLVAYAIQAENETTENLGFFVYFPPNKLTWKVAFVTNQAEA